MSNSRGQLTEKQLVSEIDDFYDPPRYHLGHACESDSKFECLYGPGGKLKLLKSVCKMFESFSNAAIYQVSPKFYYYRMYEALRRGRPLPYYYPVEQILL